MTDQTATQGSPRRQEIFRIAAEIFYRKGYDATSTKDIADAAGILKGSLYAHIASKEDILFAVVEEVHTLFERNVADVEAAAGEPLSRLRRFVRGHMQVALSALKQHQIYSHDWRSLNAERRAVIQRKRDEYQAYLAGLLRTAQRTGEVRADIDARLMSISLLSMLNSVHVWYREGGGASADEVIDVHCTIVLDGVLTHTN
ncbi:MAG: TetR family transcriptional regulator [Streptosporangiales bacterium]|nr:TetR family transcriptional regulator [Streptosporangiales bacterium]